MMEYIFHFNPGQKKVDNAIYPLQRVSLLN